MNTGSPARLQKLPVFAQVQLHNFLIGALVLVLAEISIFPSLQPVLLTLLQMCQLCVFHKDVLCASSALSLSLSLTSHPLFPPPSQSISPPFPFSG